MKLSVRQLQYRVAIAETGMMSKAAGGKTKTYNPYPAKRRGY